MSYFPQRCQHIKVNGTQCGCPALRQHKLCYFHQHHHDERIELNTSRARRSRRPAAFDLPVLEDANSIQVSLSQMLRLVLTGQIDAKSAGLALYTLQTASSNLPRTNFSPHRWDVVLDPQAVAQTPLGASIWHEYDFTTEEEKRAQAEAAARREAERKAQLIVEAKRRIEAEADRLSLEGQRRNAAEAQARAEAAAAEEKKQRKQEAGKGREVAHDERPSSAGPERSEGTNDTVSSNTERRSPSELIAAMKSLIKDLPPQPPPTERSQSPDPNPLIPAAAALPPPRIPPAPARPPAHVSLATVRQRIAEGEFT